MSYDKIEIDDGGFQRLSVSGTLEDSSSFRHNKTDFDAFNKFIEGLEERYKDVGRDRMIKERRESLMLWDQKLPRRWAGASLSTARNPAATEIAAKIKRYGVQSFFLQGDTGVGKTWMAHAVVRRYIGSGTVAPSQVVLLSEEAIVGMAHNGFQGRDKFEKVLNSNHKLFLIDNVGSKESINPEREGVLLDRLIDHIYTNSLIAVFTSNHDVDYFCESLGTSAGTKVRDLVCDTTVRLAAGKRHDDGARRLDADRTAASRFSDPDTFRPTIVSAPNQARRGNPPVNRDQVRDEKSKLDQFSD